MDQTLRRVALLIACLGLPGLVPLAEGASPAPVDSVAAADGDCSALVLGNGNLLEGRVRQIGDRYQVAVAGGQVEVRGADVRYVAADRDDAYRWLRGTIAQESAIDHLRLAHWCIQWQLLGYAAREVIAAHDIDPKCPGIGPLQRQLSAAVHAGQVTPKAATKDVRPRPVRKQRPQRRSRTDRSSSYSFSRPIAVARRQAPPATLSWPSAAVRSPSRSTSPRGQNAGASTPRLPRPRQERSADATQVSSNNTPPSSGRTSTATARPRDPFDPEIFNRRHDTPSE